MAVGPKYLKYGIRLRVLKVRPPELPVAMSILGDGLTVLDSDVCDAVCSKGGRVSWGSMADSFFEDGLLLLDSVLSRRAVAFLLALCASPAPLSSP